MRLVLERKDGGTVPFLSGLTAVRTKRHRARRVAMPSRAPGGRGGTGLYPGHNGKPLNGLAERSDIPDTFQMHFSAAVRRMGITTSW